MGDEIWRLKKTLKKNVKNKDGWWDLWRHLTPQNNIHPNILPPKTNMGVNNTKKGVISTRSLDFDENTRT